MSRFAKLFNAASNAVVNAWKDSSGFERRLYGWMIAFVLILTFGKCAASSIRRSGYSDGANSVRDSLSAVTVLRWHHAVDSAKAEIVHDTVSIARTIRHTDSLLVQVPETVTTPADTVRIVEAFPILRAQYDTLKRSCMDLGLQAIRLGSACDSVQQALTRDRDGWKRRAQKNGSHWYTTPLRVGLFLGGVYVGAKVIR